LTRRTYGRLALWQCPISSESALIVTAVLCRNLLKKPFILSEAEGYLEVLCSQEPAEGLLRDPSASLRMRVLNGFHRAKDTLLFSSIISTGPGCGGASATDRARRGGLKGNGTSDPRGLSELSRSGDTPAWNDWRSFDFAQDDFFGRAAFAAGVEVLWGLWRLRFTGEGFGTFLLFVRRPEVDGYRGDCARAATLRSVD
jgi:hypothetical protein